jgi:hypothetical protein
MHQPRGFGLSLRRVPFPTGALRLHSCLQSRHKTDNRLHILALGNRVLFRHRLVFPQIDRWLEQQTPHLRRPCRIETLKRSGHQFYFAALPQLFPFRLARCPDVVKEPRATLKLTLILRPAFQDQRVATQRRRWKSRNLTGPTRSIGNSALAIGQEMMEKCALNAPSDGREILYFAASTSNASPISARCCIVIGMPSASDNFAQYWVPTPSNRKPISAAIAHIRVGARLKRLSRFAPGTIGARSSKLPTQSAASSTASMSVTCRRPLLFRATMAARN